MLIDSWVIMPPGAKAKNLDDPVKAFLDNMDAAEDVDTDYLLLLRRSYCAHSQEWKMRTSEALPPKTAVLPLQPPKTAVPLQPPRQTALTVQQIYILFWPVLFYIGMISIVAAFTVACRGRGNSVLGMSWTEQGMSKGQAVVLICMYAGFGWTLSNGLVINSIQRNNP